MAAANTFNIVELLEHILSYLPCVDIVHVQRVSTFWRATMAGSVVLQTACFAQDGMTAKSTWLQECIAHQRFSTTDKTPPRFSKITRDIGLAASQVLAAISGTLQEAIVNPHVASICTLPEDCSAYLEDLYSVYPTMGRKHFYVTTEVMGSDKPSQTFRIMLLVQPGAQEVRYGMLGWDRPCVG